MLVDAEGVERAAVGVRSSTSSRFRAADALLDPVHDGTERLAPFLGHS